MTFINNQTFKTVNQNLIFTNNVSGCIEEIVKTQKPSSVFVLADDNTEKLVLPILESQSEIIRSAHKIVTKPGDDNKTLEAINEIWFALSEAKSTRNAMLINVGGGVVTDMGGFAGATFKRGMMVVNVPTTLLGAVDASVGGKTGINFNGYKNQIGAFSEPEATIISTTFFQTLPVSEKLAGYAEMIKHALLKDESVFKDLLKYDITLPPTNPETLLDLIRESVLIKKEFVDVDPTEKGLRKALNLGHTIAHAFESLALNERKSPVSHGFAVAQGLVVEAILSNMEKGFNSAYLNLLATYVKEKYTPFGISCDDYPKLMEYMHQDKKNDNADEILFTLLEAPGKPVINVPVPEEEIRNALDIYRDLMGI